MASDELQAIIFPDRSAAFMIGADQTRSDFINA
jgi:hypothetical protein